MAPFRSRVERQAALHEQTFRNAIEDALPSGIATVAEDGLQTYVNERFCDLVGWTAEELVGRMPPFVYWPPEEIQSIQEVFKEAAAGVLGPAGCEIILMNKCGERIPVQVLVSPMRDVSHPGWLYLVIDNRERKRSEAAREEASRLESLGHLAGQVAHDINNLLSIITINIAVIRQATEPHSELSEPLAALAEAAKRGSSFTKTLLAVARKQNLKIVPLELTRELRELSALFSATCGGRIQLELSLPEEEVWVEVDVGGLSGALLNLVANSRDAMPEGGKLSLSLQKKALVSSALTTKSPLRPGPHAVIDVADTGHGMSHDVKNRAFEPLFSTKAGVGTGLGLSVVYEFARQSGGIAEIESELGAGAVVRIFLPLFAPPPFQTE